MVDKPVPDRAHAGVDRLLQRVLATGPHTLGQLAGGLAAVRYRAGARTLAPGCSSGTCTPVQVVGAAAQP